MRKYIYTLLLVITFVYAKAQFNFGSDTVALFIEANKLKSVGIVIDNKSSSTDLEYKWKETKRVLDTSWGVQFCDCRECYSDYHNIAEGVEIICDGVYKIPAGAENKSFKFYVNPKNITEKEGFLSIRFEDLSDATSNGSITFRAIKSPTGINELKFKNNLKVYPNPVDNQLNISYDTYNSKTEKIYLTISNLLGEKIYLKKLPTGAIFYNLDCSEFQTGIYFVTLKTKEGENLAVKKIIVK